MKKTFLIIAIFACISSVLIAGCGSPLKEGAPAIPPPPEQFPAATSTYQTSGDTFATGYALTETIQEVGDNGTTYGTSGVDDMTGALGTLASKSDGQYLYVKVSFSKVGKGRLVCLLVDDAAKTSGFPVSGQLTHYLPWEGQFNIQYTNFDPDFGMGAQRNWGPATWQSTKAFTYTGNTQGSNTAVNFTSNPECKITDISGGGTANSIYEFKIPYTLIGTGGAHSGDHIKLVALLGRGMYSSGETLITARPLGVSSAIPGDAVTLANSGQNSVRIATIGSYVKCTLQ